MICPRCKIPMMIVQYEGIELDLCVDCRGVWFDRGELLLLFGGSEREMLELRQERIASLPQAQTSEQRRKCPLCRRKMRKLLVGPEESVLIDACPDGEGLWFDGGEVEALGKQYLETQAAAPREVLHFMKRVFHNSDPSGDREGQEE